MWIKRYRMCVRFASMFDSFFRFDIVHDAWIYYYHKTGLDLFLIDLRNESSYLYTVIKRAFFRWLYHERRSSLTFHTDNVEQVGGDSSPLEQAIYGDMFSLLFERLKDKSKENEHVHYRIRKDLPLDIFRLRAMGYDNVSIAAQLSISKQLVGQYVDKIKKLYG